jgi:hypothetical protein
MEAIYFTDTSVEFQRTPWNHIPEDRILVNGRFEELEFFIKVHDRNLIYCSVCYQNGRYVKLTIPLP